MSIVLNVPTELPPPPSQENAPMIKYPPFPPVPAGVSIIPFRDFKPTGIKSLLDPSEDDIELDGTGRPTAILNVKHVADKWKKKKRRMGEDDDGVVRKYNWWEEWEKDEVGRRTAQMTDPTTTRSDRFIQAAHDFRSGRPWPPITTGLQPVYDNVRLYVGLISSPPSQQKKKKSSAGADGDEESDDEADLDEEAGVNPIDSKKSDIPSYTVQEAKLSTLKDQKTSVDGEEIDEEFARQLQASEDRRQARMDAFLDDPAASMAVFFSSHYRDKGLIWSEIRCRDGPILLMFFISFLLRNNVFMDKTIDDGLRKSLEIVKLAKKELPASFIIGKAFPDLFSEGCQQLWGSMLDTIYVGSSTPMDAEDAPDPIAESVSRMVEEEGIDIESATPLTWGNTADPGSTWGTSDGTANWGNTGDDDSTWGTPNPDEPNPWAAEPTWDIGEAKSLTSLLGPTVLPLTHTTGVVENSTRKVKAILPPQPTRNGALGSSAEAIEAELDSKFGRMVMAPWPDWDEAEKSDFSKPTFTGKSRGAVLNSGEKQQEGGVHAHDPLEDDVSVLVEPSILKELVEGMGIGATWIQIARLGSDGKPVPGAPNLWYLERISQFIPSYYVDP